MKKAVPSGQEVLHWCGYCGMPVSSGQNAGGLMSSRVENLSLVRVSSSSPSGGCDWATERRRPSERGLSGEVGLPLSETRLSQWSRRHSPTPSVNSIRPPLPFFRMDSLRPPNGSSEVTVTGDLTRHHSSAVDVLSADGSVRYDTLHGGGG